MNDGDDATRSALRATASHDVRWWRRAVVYQIYPRSFADADGDGVGDIDGIRSRLPYLRALGIDAIWICPWYRSPLRDGGYDVADFREIDPRLGTLEAAERLIEAAHATGIRVIIDLVPNHVSSDHDWFVEALRAPAGSPARDRFHFRDSIDDDGALPPNNWQSVFGGSAWQRIEDGQWYLHLFDRSQPDLDWSNESVRAEFDDIIRFWLARGVDGFRIDVAQGMGKHPDYPDVMPGDGMLGMVEGEEHPFWDRPDAHALARRWRRLLDRSERDVVMVAEAWVDTDRIPKYLRDDEYHQSFNFDFLAMRWSGSEACAAIDRALQAARTVRAAPTWMLSGHDVMRHATRFGLPNDTDLATWPLSDRPELLDAAVGLRRARAATLLVMALPGSLYLYQGEELGLPEVWDLPVEVLQDPVYENSDRQRKGRDGCRVPLPWSDESPSFGFGGSPGWLPQPPRFAELSVARQEHSPDSTLAFYRAALALRRVHLVRDEVFEWLEIGDDTLAFLRGGEVVCVVNFGNEDVELPSGRLLIGSDPDVSASTLPASSAAWVAR